MKTEMPHTHFCKRKKEKKESRLALWRVSKKQVFRVKYYPYASVETLSGCYGFENVWVEILSGTEGLNLLFWIPGTKLWLLFILFFVKMFTSNVLMKTDTGIIQTGLVNKGVVFFFLLDDLDYAFIDNMSLWRWEKEKHTLVVVWFLRML